jgi:uncharacterized repeat protein (TIGR01451 family)
LVRVHLVTRTTRQSPTHAFATPSWFRYGVIALAVAVLCSCRSTEPSYRVAQWTDGDGAVHKTATPAVSPTIKESIRGQSPAQQAAYLPTQVLDGGPPPRDGLGGACCPEGCQLGPDGCYVGPNGAGVPCSPEGAPCNTGCACCGPDGLRGPDDEYLCDGGDFGSPAAVVKGGDVVGLEREDAIAHYDTIDGRTVVTPSNKVCIYAPRFAAIRQVVDLRALARIDAAHGEILNVGPARLREKDKVATSLAEIEPNIHRVRTPPSLLRERDQAGELDRDRRVAVTLGNVAPYANFTVIRTGELVGTDVVKLARSSLNAITWAGDQAAQVVLDSRRAIADVGVKTPGTIYLLVEPNNPKLRLIKCASTSAAQPGEEVEFTLRFDNVGDRVIGNVTILDSLTNRLEYIDGSQKCSMKADFDTRANEGDSLKLRWEIQEPVKKGEGGVIQFRCRVR